MKSDTKSQELQEGTLVVMMDRDRKPVCVGCYRYDSNRYFQVM